MSDEFKNIPKKVNLEQFDVTTFSKEKIRELFQSGKVPTAEVMVDEILLRALKQRATDLLLEPTDTELRVRLGFEGVMKKLVSLPKEISENLTNVIKTKANLNAFEKRKPQEGRFTMTIATTQVDIRITTLPTVSGERIAVRFLQKNMRIATLEELGFSEENLGKLHTILRKPAGLFLITGPAASGKTTTMYAAINDIQSAEKNIITIENPIEFKVNFASQISLPPDKTLTMEEAIRSVLRQGPNVLMLGDLPDAETIVAAAEAALSGTLIISTLPSGDAIGTIFRLLNLGVPPYWLASSLVGILYQQLVRKICPSCKEEYNLSAEERATMREMITDQTKFYRGKGCDNCGGTGHRDRTAVHEVLIMNDELRDQIYQHGSILKLKEAAKTAGFQPIAVDGFQKVANGITSPAEFARILG